MRVTCYTRVQSCYCWCWHQTNLILCNTTIVQILFHPASLLHFSTLFFINRYAKMLREFYLWIQNHRTVSLSLTAPQRCWALFLIQNTRERLNHRSHRHFCVLVIALSALCLLILLMLGFNIQLLEVTRLHDIWKLSKLRIRIQAMQVAQRREAVCQISIGILSDHNTPDSRHVLCSIFPRK